MKVLNALFILGLITFMAGWVWLAWLIHPAAGVIMGGATVAMVALALGLTRNA